VAPRPHGTFREGPVHRGDPGPDDAALRRIAGMVSQASDRMEKVESASASLLLDEAEKECRSYRVHGGDAPVPRGDLSPAGDPSTLGREGVRRRGPLFPCPGVASGFTPDPALFPRRCCPYGKRSVTALSRGGAPGRVAPLRREIFVDGERRGVTPARVRTKSIAPIRIRVSHPGYRDAETSGQWLPGDTEIVRFSLPGDRVARLGELLAGGAQGKGGGAGPLVGELSAAAGTSRVAILMLEKGAAARGCARGSTPEGRRVRIRRSWGYVVPRGKERSESSGKWVADALAADGWPRADRPESSWYGSPWFWGILLSVGVAVVVGAGGGGGGGGSAGGSSGGSVGVNF